MRKFFKDLFLIFSLCMISVFASAERAVFIEGAGDFNIPIQNTENKKVLGSLKTSFGGGGKIEFRPFPKFGIFTSLDYMDYKSKDVSSYGILSGDLGCGVRWPFLDRFTADADLYAGVYTTAHSVRNEKIRFSGIDFGADAGVSFLITPVFSAKVSAGYRNYFHKDFPIQGVECKIGLSVNLTEAFSHKEKVTCDLTKLEPVFPVLYSWYNENSFGEAEIYNGEENAITNVRVYFYLEQYMTQPKLCGEIKKLKKGQSEKIDLKAFFNENILELTEKTDTTATIILEYYRLSKREKLEVPVTIPVYNRNSMSWDDDRRAAVFVSSRDSTVLSFAKQVASAVRSNIVQTKNENMQYAAALYEALSLWGMNYVIDPSSAYSNNVGTTSIDFLQFPYQSLFYKGGDCDDLSILYCSLLEALGIESAFITVPGHIYAAFDTGLSENEGRAIFNDDAIYDNGRAWIPVEITLTKDGFEKTRRYGISEWNKAAQTGDAMIYPMHESWKIYKPVTPPANGDDFFLTNKNEILNAFLRARDSL